MNRLTIIGNLTKDPELRTTPSGKDVCNFTVAVNRKGSNGENAADYFRVHVWEQQARNCAQYLTKGKKVCVVGPVSISQSQNNGKNYVNLDVSAREVEFLSPRSENGENGPSQRGEAYDSDLHVDQQSGMTVVDGEELPF